MTVTSAAGARHPWVGHMRPTRGELALTASAAAAYFVLSFMVFELLDPAAAGAPWWPGAGVTLGALCISRRQVWPLLLVAIFASDVAVDLVHGTDLDLSLVWASANTIEPLLGALALAVATGGRRVALHSVGDVARFVVVALAVGPPVASLFGTLAGSVLLGDQPFWPTWPRWYIGDVLGILAVAPVMLAVPELRLLIRGPRFAVALAAVAAVTFIVFASTDDVVAQLPYLVTPLLLVAALQFGPGGAAAAGAAMALIANVMSGLGRGPFALVGDDYQPLLVLQVFVATQVLTTLVIAAQRSVLRDTQDVAETLAQEQLVDPLTGLGNRLLLDGALAELAHRAPARPGEGVSVLFVDVDGFKAVNDSYGHEAGDAVLRGVGTRLAQAVRPADIVVRVGGDEFAVVCGDIGAEAASLLADRVAASLDEPLTVAGAMLPVHASVGVSWAPAPVADPRALLADADLDMYRAKRARRGEPAT